MNFYLQQGHGTSGPFHTESVPARECGGPQAKRGKVTATRFMIQHNGRWLRVYSDHGSSLAYPHFVNVAGARVAVSGVSP